ncbi:DUF4298 domain-containing protein [Leuconostoc lactis]|uniref:DUF4298 domain-containing protein n=1 Tax=Leuconostoc lactis TaxID=1246 RepID=UPI001E2D791B|nr:DUF4298 domain-containing protein [Leuconostoc lactis]
MGFSVHLNVQLKFYNLPMYNNYIELKNFYGSEKWFEYMEIEKIPVKCGVLTEDQLFDMIGDHNELLGVLLDLTSKMYKNF